MARNHAGQFRPHCRSGFTLAEALIASVVLAVAAVGVAAALAVSSQQARAFDLETAALSQARQLMEEIAARPFDPPASNDQPGWSAGSATKDSYDNVADYGGYTDAIAAMPATNGNLSLADSVGYDRTVAFEYRTTPTGSAAVSGDFAMVTVTVTPDTSGLSSGCSPIVLTRLVARFPVVRN